ncbi:YecA family protein [Xenophilus sp. AP218F]|nr:YecA family protein [Chromobacterium sp. ASV5]OWY38561.1 YecA family protein [Xenophilus sp. AP218F]
MSITVFNDADLLRLEQLLTPLSASGSTMRPDEVQGFFAALASGPDAVDADFWLEDVLGDAPAFENPDDQAELKVLLQKLFDATRDALAAGEELDLILYADEDSEEEGEPDYWPWANAYLYALDLVDTDWFEVAEEDEGFESLMMPMLVLGGAFEDEEGGEDLLTFTDEEVEGYKEELNDALVAVFSYWRAKEKAPSTVRREGDKVGRNDPCPCGSGKKYKACCGSN